VSKSVTMHHEQADVVVRHYARLAPAYDRLWDRYTRRSLGKLAASLPWSGDERVLDVACGTGRLAAMIRQDHPGVHITGLDVSPAMIKVARRRLPEDEATRWKVGMLSSVELEPSSFDIVTCASAFHLFTDQDEGLAQMARLVRPGGTVCIVDWCREYPQIRGIQALARVYGKQYRNILTRAELRAKASRAGLTVVSEERFRATWFWAMMCMVAIRP
jgi:ubiquinone/menaquinone biosynthesis C-methylase UbiE